MAGKKKPNTKKEKIGIVVATDDGVEYYYQDPAKPNDIIFNTRMYSPDLQSRSMALIHSMAQDAKLHEHPEFDTFLTKLSKMKSR
jgi:hypothetical protein